MSYINLLSITILESYTYIAMHAFCKAQSFGKLITIYSYIHIAYITLNFSGLITCRNGVMHQLGKLAIGSKLHT